MNTKNILPTMLGNLATRRAERRQHAQLVNEVASFSSPAERLELELIISSYPDEQTAELREILDRQPAAA